MVQKLCATELGKPGTESSCKGVRAQSTACSILQIEPVRYIKSFIHEIHAAVPAPVRTYRYVAHECMWWYTIYVRAYVVYTRVLRVPVPVYIYIHTCKVYVCTTY